MPIMFTYAFFHKTGFLYILGALLYALRVPERWFPGKFDLWVRLMPGYFFIFLHN